MEVGSLPEAECLTFRNRSGGDTLDAFAPLAQYTERNHAGMTQSAWMQLSHTIINSAGEVLHRVRMKENEIVPEWAGLLTAKSKDPLDKAELRALNMRKSKKQEMMSKRRELFGNKTPKDRSVSFMFGEATQVNPGVGSLNENDAAA